MVTTSISDDQDNDYSKSSAHDVVTGFTS